MSKKYETLANFGDALVYIYKSILFLSPWGFTFGSEDREDGVSVWARDFAGMR